MMKKLRIILMALLLSLGLTACSKSEEKDPVTPPVVETTVTSIAVKNLKSEFMVGDKFEAGVLTVTMSDESTKEVPITEAMVSGFDTTEAGTKTLTITYEGKTVNYEIKVKPAIVMEADSYYYVLEKSTINTNGGTLEKNGLTWNYGESIYVGWDGNKGVQFGSSKRPITTPLTFSATFPSEVIVTDYAIEVSVGSSGKSNLTVTLGESYSETTPFDNTEAEGIEAFDLNVKTNKFEFTLQSEAKATYLKSISFSILKNDNSFDLEVDDTNIEVGPVTPGVTPSIPQINHQLVSIEEYYKNTDLTLTKDALRAELNTLVSDMTKTTYGDASNMLMYIDEDINKPGKLNTIYTNGDYNAIWDGTIINREHVWACNHMRFGNAAGSNYRPDAETADHRSDLHNLRICEKSVNSSRGDKLFGNQGMENVFYPNLTNTKDERGDVARILLYMYVRYTDLSLDEIGGDTSMGKLSVLITWANEDKVDAFEKQRNNRIYEYQGNRNPFIDHPELVNQLFA